VSATFEDIQALIQRHDILILDFKQIDLDGRWHHLTIPVERFTPQLMTRGIGFDGSSYGFVTIEKSDMVFIPDLDSAFVDPVANLPTLAMIGEMFRIGDGYTRFESDPRHVAELAESHLAASGVADTCLFGPEFEFYVLDNVEFRTGINHIEVHLDSAQAEWNSFASPYAAPGHNPGYTTRAHGGYHSDMPYDLSFGLRNTITRALEDVGVPVKYHHGENGGPGQVEIEVEFAPLREIADRACKLKYVVKNLAVANGKTVTFMPKPFLGESGSGMHVHMHMFKDGRPVFYDEAGYAGLSQTALHAIGGILTHAAALTGFTCPSTNSYKRLVPDSEAPVSICFGAANRTSVIRIPGYARSPETKRFEFRSPDATANPYLCFSAILMAAIDGIQREIDPIRPGFGPYDKNMYHLSDEDRRLVTSLPHSLAQAADALEADHEFLLAGGVFSEDLIRNQLAKCRRDAAELDATPHPLEFQKYYDL